VARQRLGGIGFLGDWRSTFGDCLVRDE
jgi:hypothetical protein